MINEKHISYDKFLRNELKTLGVIEGLSAVNSNLKELAISAKNAYQLYRGRKSYDKLTFEYNCVLSLVVEGRERKVLIEAIMQPHFAILSYAVIIFDDESKEVLRKFHFDYAIPIDGQVPKPIYHIQYGGKTTPFMNSIELNCENLETWLSSPRINGVPYNLAIIIDRILIEFPSEGITKIINSSEWRELIKHNEDLILKEYYENIAKFFASKHKSDCLYRDYLYG